ncbi:transmembrane protein 230 isoform X1 [Etheostoma spectabile]|uniref:transmembrane protein 230 isoform X1 n=2 Tax=Etheostoma spectabile TaxID=54343 RepID=UPI0013AF8019|nr:transmembrane protein 230-like isoform X1 [Etheostoma spectabile]
MCACALFENKEVSPEISIHENNRFGTVEEQSAQDNIDCVNYTSSKELLMQAIRSNMLGVGISNNKVKYSRLAADEDGYIDLQFKKSPPKVPYKAIALAIFLFLIGSLLIVFGALLLSGTIKVEHPDRTIPVIVIGLLVFLPGFYHLRIAYFAAKGYRGYSYDDIPDFGD